MINKDVLFGTPRAISMWVISVFFVIAFAAYFNILANRDVIGLQNDGEVGSWSVSFNELLDSENSGPQTVEDGQSATFSRTLMPDTRNFGMVQISITCDDGGGVGDADDTFSVNVAAPEGINVSSFDGTCDNNPVIQEVKIINGYDGEEYNSTNSSKNEINSQWTASEGYGHGEWNVDAQITTEAGLNIFGDNEATVTIEITAITFELEVTEA